MASIEINFKTSNNADWIRGFSLIRQASGDLPWANVPEWSDEGVYQSSSPASIVVHEDNLYIAKPPGASTEGTFIDDEWLLIGNAEAWTAEPIDLTDMALTMRLAPKDKDGNVDLDAPAITLATVDGTLELTSPSAGGMAFNLRAAKARSLPAGTYAYDLLGKRGADTIRLMHGDVIVEQGISR